MQKKLQIKARGKTGMAWHGYLLMLMIVPFLLFFAQKSFGQVIISQYYEGSSNNKWIELTNVGSSDIDLSVNPVFLFMIGGSSAKNVTTTAPSLVASFNSGTFVKGSSKLIKNSSAALPTYCTADISSGSLSFNGAYDVVFLSTSNSVVAGTAWAARTDIVCDVVDNLTTATSYADRSLYRNFNILTGNVTYTPAEWTQNTNVEVDNANLSTTSEKLGLHIYSLPCSAPSTQPGIFSFNSIQSTLMNLNLASTGNGDKVLIVANASDFTTAIPTDGTVYNADLNFSGTGSDFDGGKVIFAGNAADVTSNMTITGLSASTNYRFKAFAYNDCSGSPKYFTTNPVTGNQTTQAANSPTISITASLNDFTTLTGIASTSQSYTVSGSNLIADITVNAPAEFEVSTDNSIFNSSVVLTQSGGTITNQIVYIRIKASTGSGVYNKNITHNSSGASEQLLAVTAKVLATEPTASRFVAFTNVDMGKFTIVFPSVANSGHKRLVVVKQGSAVDWTPTDGVAPSGVNNNYNQATDQGNGNFIVYDGDANSTDVYYLNVATTYHVAVFEYNWDGTNNETRNYFLTAGTGSQETSTAKIPGTATFDNDWNFFTVYDKTGTQVWTRHLTYGVSNTPCLTITGKSGSNCVDNEHWLISPPINLDESTNEKLSFQYKRNNLNNGKDLELFYSTTYPGTGDPTSYFTNSIPSGIIPSNSTNTWSAAYLTTPDIDISTINGKKVYFAFKFSSLANESNCEAWDIDNVNINAYVLPKVTIDNPPAEIGSIRVGKNHQPLYKFKLSATENDVVLKKLQFTTTGTFTANDITAFSLIYSTDPFIDLNDVVINSFVNTSGSGTFEFSSLNQIIYKNKEAFFLITANVSQNAVVNNTIEVNPITTSDFEIAEGLKYGTTNNGGIKTILPANAELSTITTANGEWTNIPYASYISSSIGISTEAAKVWSFTISDGGGTDDGDNQPTKLISLTINKGDNNSVINWGSTIKKAALFDGTNLIAVADVSNESITFSNLNVITNQNSNKTLDLYVTFKTHNIIDREQFQFKLVNTQVIADYNGSTFKNFSTQSSISGDANKIQVTMSKLVFLNQPVNIPLNVAMPEITIAAFDDFNNIDKDQSDVVSLTSDGTLQTSPLTVSMTDGKAVFNNIVHTAFASNRKLTATYPQSYSVLSNSFNIGSIITVTGTVYDFRKCYVNHFSTRQWVRIKGQSITNNIVINAPANFEISLECNTGYTNSLTLIPKNNEIIEQQVFIRFKPTTTGVLTGNVTFSGGMSPVDIAVSGNGIAENSFIPNGYYSNVSATNGAEMKTQLSTIISSNQIQLNYTSPDPNVWNAYITSDIKFNGKIWDIYTDRACDDPASPARYFTPITDQDKGGSATSEGVAYNREHSFPKSWFNMPTPVAYEGTDLMHLYPTDKYINSPRGNMPYGKVGTPTQVFSNGSKIGTCIYPGYSGTVFEPIDEYKGDLARTYFYMATRYQASIATWNYYNSTDVLALNTFPVFKEWFLKMLMDWHHNDPVSQKEIERNEAIYQYQNNRNPFVDHPEWVDAIWGSGCSAPTTQAGGFSSSATNDNSTTISWSSNGNGDNVIVLGKFASPVDATVISGSTYNANAAFGQGSQVGIGNYVLYYGNASSVNITNLKSYSNYHFAVFAANGTCYRVIDRLTGSIKTLPKNEPTNHPTNFQAGTIGTSSVSLTWIDATGAVLPDGYIIFASKTNSFTDPVDLNSPVQNNLTKHVAYGTQKVTFGQLELNTIYYFKIYPYTNSGDAINYKTDGTPLTAQATTLQSMTIADARKLSVGTEVTITGIITAGSEMGTKNRYIQDATGGILLYSSAAAFGNTVIIGDEVTVTGTLKLYNNLLELDPISSFKVNSQGNTVPAPILITPSDFNDNYESMLVRLDYVKFTSTGSFVTSTNYNFTAKSLPGVIRTTSSAITGTIPAKTVSVIGILSQYSTSDPNAGYQFLPRIMADFIPANIGSVNTGSATNVASITANLSGEVISDGLSEIYARGVCWSTSLNPTISDNSLAIGSGIGAFNHTVTGLQSGTTYHFRAFAINDIGVAYGNDIEFTTNTRTPQTITFNSLPVKKVGDADFAAIATASSGLPVTFVSANPSVATIVNGSIHVVGAGTSVITASQAGNETYEPAPNVQQTLTVNPATGFEDIAAIGVRIYPNPSDGHFVIQFENNLKQMVYDVKDITGRIIQTGIISSSSKQIDLSAHKKGIYLLQLKVGDKSYLKKLVIQ